MTLNQENMRSAGLDEAVRLFGEAWAGGDIAKLEELLSPSYTHIDYFKKNLLRFESLELQSDATQRYLRRRLLLAGVTRRQARHHHSELSAFDDQ